jgi:hypothetical protein
MVEKLFSRHISELKSVPLETRLSHFRRYLHHKCAQMALLINANE